MCVDFSTFGLRIRCSQVTFSIGFMLGSQPRLSPVLSDLLFASDSFRARLRMADWCLHGSLWYHGVAVYLAVLSLRVRCCRTVVGGRYLCLPLPYRRWGTVSVLIAAIPSLGNGICAYCCHTIVVRWYMCLLLPYHRCEMVYVLLHSCTDPGGLYLCLLAV